MAPHHRSSGVPNIKHRIKNAKVKDKNKKENEHLNRVCELCGVLLADREGGK